MTLHAQQIFEKTMSRVPAEHRKLSFAEVKAATEKKMVLMERGKPFHKIIDQPLAFDRFEDAVEHLKKIHGCSGTEAMRKAADAHPRLLEAYQAAGAVSYRPNFEKAARPQAVQRFNLIVDGIAERNGVSRVEAMRRTARTHPTEFQTYQSA